VNWHHPHKYLMKLGHSGKRFKKFNHNSDRPSPWSHTSKHNVLLAGMGPKSFDLYKMHTQAWDKWALEEIQKNTERNIVYRPKPSWIDAKTLPGTTFSHVGQSLDAVLNNTHVVVTHHSNVAVDALMRGIPAICVDGAAYAICDEDFTAIDEPKKPERAQFLWNLAWCNWSVSEMESGACWRYIREQVLPIS
jgi:hypothetical protein